MLVHVPALQVSLLRVTPKHNIRYEKTAWWSDGTVLGERAGRSEETGEAYSEKWRQVLRDGIEMGSLSGSNEQGDTWEEEWETAALHAIDCETGESPNPLREP